VGVLDDSVESQTDSLAMFGDECTEVRDERPALE
jgi:hypothetical protein